MCGLFSYLAYVWWHKGEKDFAWVLGGAAVVYNPLVPLHLGREAWVLVNIVRLVSRLREIC